MATVTPKTNAVRLLESRGLVFSTVSYDWDEDHLDAATVAAKIQADPDRVFKTLVARSDQGEILVFCVPGTTELDLKKAARVTGCKRVEMVRAKELPALTGYQRGGCSPVGMKRSYRTTLDETALLFERIYVSAGLRGMQIEVAPDDLIVVSEASVADVIFVPSSRPWPTYPSNQQFG